MSKFLHKLSTNIRLLALAFGFCGVVSAETSWQCEHQRYSDKCVTHESQQDLGLASSDFDWYDRSMLPLHLQKDIPTSCGGMYIEKAIISNYSDLPIEERPIEAMADSIQSQGNSLYLYSNVELIQDGLSIRADVASINRDENNVELNGDIEIREPGILLTADTANIQLETKVGKFENTQYVLHQKHMFGKAKSLERPESEILIINEGSYSTCSPIDNDWSITAKKITIDNNEGWGNAKHMVFRIHDVPVFYFPSLDFPVDDRRMSGFLYPSFAYTSNGGVDIAAPYYLNIAPNYDATLTPRYVSGHGSMLETEFRYLNAFSEWQLTNNYIENDKKFDSHRWFTQVEQSGQFNDYISSGIKFTRVSDINYLDDLDPTQISVTDTDHLRQTGWLAYNSSHWSSRIEVNHFQTIKLNEKTPYAELPNIDLSFRPSSQPFTIQPVFNNQYTFFASQTDPRGHRTFNETGLNYQAIFNSGYLIPELKVWNIYYDLLDSNDVVVPFGVVQTGNTRKSIPTFNLLGGLYFDRYFTYEDDNLLHTIEPKFYYVNTKYVDQSQQPDFNTSLPGFSYQSLFRDNDFIGYDRFSDTHKLSIALENYLINADTGQPFFSFNIGQSYFFKDRKVFLPDANENEFEQAKRDSSMIASETAWYFAQNWALSNQLVYEPYKDKIDSNLTLLKYQIGPYSVFNAGFFFRQNDPRINPVTFIPENDDTQQAVVSAAFPVAKNWALFAATQYDLLQDQAVNNFAGVEYNSCCWTFRLAYLYERNEDDANPFDPITGDINYDQDETLYFEIQLRGLGGFSDRITALLEKSILGYGDESFKNSKFR